MDIAFAYDSPWLIAVNRVLHRLLVPRHPPCALYSLTFNSDPYLEICVKSLLKIVVSFLPYYRLQHFQTENCKRFSLYLSCFHFIQFSRYDSLWIFIKIQISILNLPLNIEICTLIPFCNWLILFRQRRRINKIWWAQVDSNHRVDNLSQNTLCFDKSVCTK